MTAEEYLKCIKTINPDAHVTIRQSPDSEPYPKWDEAHTGTKPTREECEAVLAEVKAEIQLPLAINAIQTILDAKAKENGFDTIHTAAVWTISKNPNRAARAIALMKWGDNVWDFAEAEWERQAEGKGTYSTVEAFLAALPKFPGVVG